MVYPFGKVMSFPLRERGLKHHLHIRRRSLALVVPLAGTWIETTVDWEYVVNVDVVVPLAGTWIETRLRPRVEEGL